MSNPFESIPNTKEHKFSDLRGAIEQIVQAIENGKIAVFELIVAPIVGPHCVSMVVIEPGLDSTVIIDRMYQIASISRSAAAAYSDHCEVKCQFCNETHESSN